jgi:hypothetical protein
MTKSTLESFIKKYFLNGNNESVKLVSNKKVLKASTITEDKNVLSFVTLSNFEGFDDAEVGIYNTSKLKQMLGVLSTEIDVSLNKDKDKVTSLTLSDDKIEVKYVTADLSVIPTAPNLKQIPAFNFNIVMDENFIDKFIKAKNALPEVGTFTLLKNKKGKVEMVIGYAPNINSDRITLNVTPQSDKDDIKDPISFSAIYLKEILLSNADSGENAVLKVSDKGLANISFKNGDFESNYYMVAIQLAD